MRLLAALATGFFSYLAVGFATGNAPNFRRSRTPRQGAGAQALWLSQAGVDLTPRQFWAGSMFVGLLGFGFAWALSGAWVVAAVPALTMAVLPRAYFSRQRSRRLAETVEAWPDGLRDLTASIQAGRSLPQAIESMAATGPPALRRAFDRFPTLNQMFGTRAALETIKEDLADPTSDRVVEVLTLAWERGGSSVTGILSDLADAVTEDLRTLEEIRTAELEQKINARAVFALPWFVLLMITIRGGPFREFYQSPAGIVTVVLGGVLSLIGLLIVARLSRDPAETRVFAAPQSTRVAS
ncbi:MAG: type II secretion system F family protein [Acidimicrobiia bacterium]|nr:type II secretion system F family protein [Acidimicrobiia bacterium]